MGTSGRIRRLSIQRLQAAEGGALVEAAAAWAAGEVVIGGVLELEGAEGAPETVAEGAALAAEAADVPDDPIAEDEGEEDAEVEEHEHREGDVDHGEASGDGVGRA